MKLLKRAEWLERAFEEEEVIDVVGGMARDKALSPYGFSMAFFRLVRILCERML